MVPYFFIQLHVWSNGVNVSTNQGEGAKETMRNYGFSFDGMMRRLMTRVCLARCVTHIAWLLARWRSDLLSVLRKGKELSPAARI